MHTRDRVRERERETERQRDGETETDREGDLQTRTNTDDTWLCFSGLAGTSTTHMTHGCGLVALQELSFGIIARYIQQHTTDRDRYYRSPVGHIRRRNLTWMHIQRR